MNLSDFARAEHLAALAPAVAAALFKGTVILVLGTGCSLLARGASAASRHMIWTLTLGGALAMPVISAVVPRWTLRVGYWPFAAVEVPALASGLTVPAALTGRRPMPCSRRPRASSRTRLRTPIPWSWLQRALVRLERRYR